MSTNTSIEWTDATWNPVRGCSPVSPGCKRCYAEIMAGRFCGPGKPFEGFVQIGKNGNPGPHWTGKVELIEKHLHDPLHWREPRRIFVNSMSDLFHEALPDEAIDGVFAVMALCPQHTFQVLTKRPERMRQWFREDRSGLIAHRLSNVVCRSEPVDRLNMKLYVWPLPNVWLGVSIEDQKTADERIPLLFQTPAAVRFVSYEPALGPVDFHKFLIVGPEGGWEHQYSRRQMLDWVIVGGESGPGARPFDIAWARSVIAQCKAAGVACFVKQMGAVVNDSTPAGPLFHRFRNRKGGDWSEWPAYLRVREFPK